MLNIYKYSMIYTFKKKSTWILLALLTLVSWGIPYSIANSVMGNMATGDTPRIAVPLTNPLIAFAFFIFYAVMLMSYVSIKSLDINKDGEDDGSTLLLVSKKFTRGDIVFGRFFAVMTHLLFAATFVFLGILLADIMLKGPSGFEYATSLFAGTLIIGAVFVSFATLLSTSLGRVGTMFISIVVAFGMVLGNTIFSLVGGANPYSTGNFEGISNITTAINDEGKQETFLSVDSTDGTADDYVTEKYRTYSKFDVWYQLSSTLLLFTEEDVDVDKLDYQLNSASRIEEIKNSISVEVGTGANTINIYRMFETGSIGIVDQNDNWFEIPYIDIANGASKVLTDIYEDTNKTKLQLVSEMADGAINHHEHEGIATPPSMSQLFDIVGELTFNFDTYISDYNEILDGTKYFEGQNDAEDNSWQHSYKYGTSSSLVQITNMRSTFDDVSDTDYDGDFTFTGAVKAHEPQVLSISVLNELQNNSAYTTSYGKVTQPDFSSVDEGRFRDNKNSYGVRLVHFNESDFRSSFTISPYMAKSARILIWSAFSIIMFASTLVIYYRRDFR